MNLPLSLSKSHKNANDARFNFIMRRACEQRLLPSIVSQLEQQQNKRELLNSYRKKVWSQYSENLRVPQEYEEGEQLTEYEKLERKIKRIVDKRVPIEYLQMNKDSDGRFHPTFQGRKLDEVIIPTKQQFKIFVQCTEDSFKKKTFDHLFDDQLQLKIPSPLMSQPLPPELVFKNTQRKTLSEYRTFRASQPKKPSRRINTIESIDKKTEPKTMRTKTEQLTIETNEPRQLPNIIPRTTSRNEKKQKMFLSMEKALSGRILSGDRIQETRKTYNRIGGYSGKNPNELLTRESITRYLKKYYEKPHRIVDFLEIPAVLNFESFQLLSEKLNLMQRLHFQFLTFLFYDTNHDGVICEGDLQRLETLSKKHPNLIHDHHKLIKIRKPPGTGGTLEKTLPDYMQLYSLPQITETAVFQWFKNHDFAKKEETLSFEQALMGNTPQADALLISMYRKRYSIRFDRFHRVFRNERPALWYELMFRFSGLRYQGIDYLQ